MADDASNLEFVTTPVLLAELVRRHRSLILLGICDIKTQKVSCVCNGSLVEVAGLRDLLNREIDLRTENALGGKGII